MKTNTKSFLAIAISLAAIGLSAITLTGCHSTSIHDPIDGTVYPSPDKDIPLPQLHRQ